MPGHRRCLRNRFRDPSNDGDVMLMLTHACLGFAVLVQAFGPDQAVGGFLSRASLELCNQSSLHWAIFHVTMTICYASCIMLMKSVYKLVMYALSMATGLILSAMIYRSLGPNVMSCLLLLWAVYLPVRMSRCILRRMFSEMKFWRAC